MRLFTLDPRLKACADMLDTKDGFVDVGTDHAYLPIWLVKSGKIYNALAVDVNPEPLKKAQLNIEKYGVSDKIKIILSNGLDGIDKADLKTAVIAGMGADTIILILKNAVWLKENKTLILQPMTAPEKLRRFLYDEGYEVLEEKAVISDKKSYSVIKAQFNKKRNPESELFPYIGKITDNVSPGDREAARLYIKKEIKNLENRKKGFISNKAYDKGRETERIILLLREEILKLNV